MMFRPTALLLALVSATVQALPERFTAIDLGSSNSLGGVYSGAQAINQAGQVVGFFESGSKGTSSSNTTLDLNYQGDLQAVRLEADGSLSAQGALNLSGADNASPLRNHAWALNQAGSVTGFGQQNLGDNVFVWQAFYSINNKWIKLSDALVGASLLPTPDYFYTGNQEHRLLAVNDANLMVGNMLGGNPNASGYYIRPILVNPNNAPIEVRMLQLTAILPPNESAMSGSAAAINNQKQIVGWFSATDKLRRGFIYDFSLSSDHQNPALKQVNSFDGEGASELRAINDAGWVAGQAHAADGSTRAFVLDSHTYSSGRLLTAENDIHEASLAPSVAVKNQYSEVYGINSVGDVVGRFRVGTSPERFHAFLYQKQQDRLLDLNNLIDCGADGVADWTLIEATSLTNPDAQGNVVVVGTGQHRVTGQTYPVSRAFKLVATTGQAKLCEAKVSPPSVSSGGGGSLGGLVLVAVAGWFIKRRY